VSWHQRYHASLARIAHFHTRAATGRYGLGTARRLDEYEAYAGISFRQRRVQDHTLLLQPPPNPPVDPDWPLRVKDRRVEIEIDASALPAPATQDPSFWYVGVHDGQGRELYRHDADAAELQRLMAEQKGILRLLREFASESAPASWTVIPHSASEGWLDRITGVVDHGAITAAGTGQAAEASPVRISS
ncbi:MAG: hypothetical protein QOD66_3327, partial [Solirubrobacteraceae bacterium]|nr:hypothetical protein [Solirubrobacteraceae bacterium]